MEKSTLILILILIGILLFATHIQYYTGKVTTWFEHREYCIDSDGGFSPFIYGGIDYTFQGYEYHYIDECDGSKIYEGTCLNGELLKAPFQCPHGCTATGPDNHGHCICEKDKECPEDYWCESGNCYTSAK